MTASGYLLWPFQHGGVAEDASPVGLGPVGMPPDVARSGAVPTTWISDLVTDPDLELPGVVIGPDDPIDEVFPPDVQPPGMNQRIREAQYVAQVDADHFTARLWQGSVLTSTVVTVRAYTFGRNMADLTPPVSGTARLPILEIDGEWVCPWWLWFIRQC